MPKIINLEDEFNSWFNESEVLSLKAAYLHGIKTAARDSVDTLRDYSVSLEGCTDYEYYPYQAYDSAAESLDVYWTDVLKDKE